MKVRTHTYWFSENEYFEWSFKYYYSDIKWKHQNNKYPTRTHIHFV